jgi:hypothetical protein
LNYIEYVEQQIRRLKETSRLIQDGHILPYKVNKALAEYEEVSLGLTAEYQRVKTINKVLNRKYQAWWDEKFLEARDSLNGDRVKSKFASKAEIESQTRHNNKREYFEWQDKLDESESKVRFILRLIDNWRKEDQILIQLSKNMTTEIRALYVQSDAGRKVKRNRAELPSNND